MWIQHIIATLGKIRFISIRALSDQSERRYWSITTWQLKHKKHLIKDSSKCIFKFISRKWTLRHSCYTSARQAVTHGQCVGGGRAGVRMCWKQFCHTRHILEFEPSWRSGKSELEWWAMKWHYFLNITIALYEDNLQCKINSKYQKCRFSSPLIRSYSNVKLMLKQKTEVYKCLKLRQTPI